MADTKISGLTSGNPAQSGDLLPIDRSGTNYSLTAASIATLAPISLLNIQVLTSTTANSTYTPTVGTRAFRAELWGGGGGGGTGTASGTRNMGCGGGGGGGAYVSYFNSAPAASYLYSCGAGGTNGANNTNGANGGDTIFGNASNNCAYANAGGGAGGQYNNVGGTTEGVAPGGNGGIPNTGLELMPGQVGDTGFHGSNNVGANGLAVGGFGGASPRGGLGGQGGQASIYAATPGGNYGGGGGGGSYVNATSYLGASGAQGAIVVWEYQ